ncbi:hypothetical protein BABINDRAFT_40339 [Babjeviella inositovora NRRL Y-12698]|uniref:Zn(2)-C6 fungal-type domain-containing protein n=1 Tax=Babjeviella inositovora NRRL Y-12698 TaxID=984486 RepID=A0A1E3QLR5_9ASCO|nr:uncharacterized protein BABINDRAFT_40339 [Babjeviella inositovora NRRL Y-12698]ODQ78022.1 hypothetical protein BABINDRAFT_40339 [Babjeviella inositovora NRRL Y-12698]
MSSDKTKRSKSFTGCFTCRSRKIRCDLQKPFCQRCQKAGFACGGYDVKLRWSHPLQFDKMANQIVSQGLPAPPPNDGEYFQRRNVEFVTYDKEYEYYEDMDQDLAKLHNAVLPDSQTAMAGPFGVFKGLEDPTKKRKEKPYRKKRKMSTESPKRKMPYTPPAFYPPQPNPLFESLPSLPGHEWLAQELRDDAILSAAAMNGGLDFLDFLYPEKPPVSHFNYGGGNILNDNVSTNNIPVLDLYSKKTSLNEDEILNLLFHKSNSYQDVSHWNSQLGVSGNGYEQPSKPAPVRTPPVSTASTSTEIDNDIHLHASGITEMPVDIMQVVTLPPLQDMPQGLALASYPLPTTTLQITPLTRYLLKYYLDHVADLMTVIPLLNNPWKNIYFPRALSAIGDLAAIGRTSNAKGALLCALLAVSAFYLQGRFVKHSPQMKYYLQLGIQLRQQATVFLRKCLTSPSPLQTEKYKDVLMGILSMVTVDTVWGTMSDCRFYLAYAQGMIGIKVRDKKLRNKTMSRKARVLHRIFSCLKLIQDSTALESYVSPMFPGLSQKDSKDMEEIDEDVLYGSKNERKKVHLEFIEKLSSTEPLFGSVPVEPSFMDRKVNNDKNSEENFTTDALYGLPNSLIFLFAEICKLSKQKMKYNKINENPPEEFHEKLATVEKRLMHWLLDWKLFDNESSTASTPMSVSTTPLLKATEGKFISLMHEAVYHHIMSFYHALIIFHYRLLRPHTPINLQPHVLETLSHLNSIQRLVELKQSNIIPLFWQGFIAGCEALDQNLQLGFKTWGASIAGSGVGSYWGARQIMLEVWRRRAKGERGDGWVNVVREWEMNLMLS